VSPRRRLLVAAAVALAAVLLLVVTVVAVTRDDDPTVAQDRPGPVLLVPAYGGGTTSLEPLAAALRRSGRDVEIVTATDGGTGDLTAQAVRLGAAVDRRIAGGAPSVDVVGYSAGGVVARIWATRLGGSRQARRVVTLGSPHHGTRVAGVAVELAGGCPVACRQLVPGSDLLAGLPETADGPVWTSLWTANDSVVTPPSSARLRGALNIPLQTVCPDARTVHGGLPSDPLVVGLVGTALATAPMTQAPGAERCAPLRAAGAPVSS